MHLIHQLFGDCHTQTGTLVGSAAAVRLLRERLKDMLQKFLAHTDAVVTDLHAQVNQPLLAEGFACAEVDGAAVRGVFYGVA